MPNTTEFTFADLFAGIGGIRQGFADLGGQCVYTSEWNKYSCQTYGANFSDTHKIVGDITLVNANSIPDHDVLLAGFPCQPFSLAGVSKKNSMGRAHGFEDPTQGTLFFDLKRILKAKRPQAFLLENVKNLLSHDKGRTFKVIKSALEDELNYELHYKVIDGVHFVPQHRERILLVGFSHTTNFSWDSYSWPEEHPTLISVLHKTDGTEPFLKHDQERFFDFTNNKVLGKYTLSPKLWTYLQNYSAKHKAAGNGFGFGLVSENSITRTLSARYYKDGSEILVTQENEPRKLTPRECARLMGFPDTFIIPVSDTQAYKQFGNSVVVPVFKEAARQLIPHLLPENGFGKTKGSTEV